jgi:hypothetical protein
LACPLPGADQLSELNQCDQSIDHRVRRSIEQFACIADLKPQQISSGASTSSGGGSRRFQGKWALHIEKRALFSLPKLIEDPGDKC